MDVADEYNMTVRQWALLERLRLDEFVAWWEAGGSGNNMDGIPANAFPATQPVPDWDEQYRGWGGA